MRARDGLDHWSLRVAGDGVARVRAADRHFLVPARQPTLSSFAIGFDSEYEAGEWITLIIPRGLDPVLSAAMARRGPGPLEGLPARMLGANLLSLARLMGEAAEDDLPGLAEGLRGLLRGCLLGAGQGEEAAEAAQHALLTERLRAATAAQIGSALLDPGRLARQLGVSRSVLYRALQPEGGVARFVKGLRLEWVRTALADPARAGVPISTLAAEAGFFDASSFHRTFRASFGCTPRAWRSGALAGLLLPVAPCGAPENDLVGLLGGRP
jgi:AraC-like DNA-binding protein